MKRSTVIPLMLLAYLGVMSYIGFDEFRRGNYLFYFGIITLTLVVIFLLRLTLLRAEKRRRDSDRKNNE
ncbi:MAG: hypothetical protein NC336_02950 [Clostridium sp.]|nr:hypothetical protein [Clostridium sp.]